MQLVFLSFKKRIYKSDVGLEHEQIEAGSVVQVRLRAGCNTCLAGLDCTLPNVPEVALGCDPRATLEANSQYVLDSQDCVPCVGEVVPITVETVTCDGRGFTFDRTLAGQNYRGSDIDMVMPDHDGVGCLDSPLPPSGLTATADVAVNTEIDLEWVDLSDNETGFEIQISPDGLTGWTTITTTAADATTYTATGLTPETEYCFRIRSVRSGFVSEYSDPVCATTIA